MTHKAEINLQNLSYSGLHYNKNRKVLAGYICKFPEADKIFLNVVAADSVNAPLIDDLTELIRIAKEKKEEQSKR